MAVDASHVFHHLELFFLIFQVVSRLPLLFSAFPVNVTPRHVPYRLVRIDSLPSRAVITVPLQGRMCPVLKASLVPLG